MGNPKMGNLKNNWESEIVNTSFEKTTGNDTWLTPKFIFDALNCEFDLDPCHIENPPFKTAKKWYTKEMDGLKQDWGGLVWCNPPYGKETKIWLEKCAEHNNCIVLIFNRMDTGYWHDIIFKQASAIKILKGRLKFLDASGTASKNPAGVGNILISFGKKAKEILRDSAIQGKFIELEME